MTKKVKFCTFIMITLTLMFVFFPMLFYQEKSVIEAASTNFSIQDQALKTKLMTLLDKEKNSFNKDDFLNSTIYNNDESPKVCIDLSNSNITDITELAKFSFPATLNYINLAGNNITTEEFTKIQKVLNASKDDELYYYNDPLDDNKDIIVKSETSMLTQFHTINIAFNQIDLTDTLINDSNNHYLTRHYIFGVQKFDPLQNGTILTIDETDAVIYIDNDENKDRNHITFNVTVEKQCNSNDTTAINKNYADNKIIKIADLNYLGRYTITFTSDEQVNVYTPFIGWTHSINFILIKPYFKPNTPDGYQVERLSNFSIPKDDIIIDGITYLEILDKNNDSGASTKHVGLNYAPIILKVKDFPSKTIIIPYNVVDTQAPVLTLIGAGVILWKQNVTWTDPGVIYTDNGSVENISVVSDIIPDYTKEGTYILTYQKKDEYGNTSEPITRTVIVSNKVITKLDITITTSEITTGKQVTFIVQPDVGFDSTFYENIVYDWYINDEFIQSTYAESDGSSRFRYIPTTTKDFTIKAKLRCNIKLDGRDFEISSQSYTYNAISIIGNDKIMLAVLIGGGAVMFGLIIAIILRLKKNNNKVSQKSKSKNKNTNKKGSENSETKNIDIQIINSPNPNSEPYNSNKKDTTPQDDNNQLIKTQETQSDTDQSNPFDW